MSPPADDDPSSFLFGLNQFPVDYSTPSSHSNQLNSNSNHLQNSGENGLGAPNSLLLGLDPFSPSAQHNLNNNHHQQYTGNTGITPEDSSSQNFADQLSLWTNANFSFDGPTGHALLAEEDEKKDEGGDKKKEEEDGERDIFGNPVNSNNKAKGKDKERNGNGNGNSNLTDEEQRARDLQNGMKSGFGGNLTPSLGGPAPSHFPNPNFNSNHHLNGNGNHDDDDLDGSDDEGNPNEPTHQKHNQAAIAAQSAHYFAPPTGESESRRPGKVPSANNVRRGQSHSNRNNSASNSRRDRDIEMDGPENESGGGGLRKDRSRSSSNRNPNSSEESSMFNLNPSSSSSSSRLSQFGTNSIDPFNPSFNSGIGGNGNQDLNSNFALQQLLASNGNSNLNGLPPNSPGNANSPNANNPLSNLGNLSNLSSLLPSMGGVNPFGFNTQNNPQAQQVQLQILNFLSAQAQMQQQHQQQQGGWNLSNFGNNHNGSVNQTPGWNQMQALLAQQQAGGNNWNLNGTLENHQSNSNSRRGTEDFQNQEDSELKSDKANKNQIRSRNNSVKSKFNDSDASHSSKKKRTSFDDDLESKRNLNPSLIGGSANPILNPIPPMFHFSNSNDNSSSSSPTSLEEEAAKILSSGTISKNKKETSTTNPINSAQGSNYGGNSNSQLPSSVNINGSTSSSSKKSSSKSNPSKEAELASAAVAESERKADEDEATRLRLEALDDIPPLKLIDTGNPEKDAEANKILIEEDKRRRNTAASARFRIKKKQREAALETSVKELQSRVSLLVEENEKLKTENTWLKGLITVRGNGKGKSKESSSDENQDEESNETLSNEEDELNSSDEKVNLNNSTSSIISGVGISGGSNGSVRNTRSSRNSKSRNGSVQDDVGPRHSGLVTRGVGTNGRVKRDRED